MKKLSKNCSRNKKSVLCITFWDYTPGGSGVSKVIIEHQRLYNAEGYDYFCIFPLKKYQIGGLVKCWALLLDGKYVTVISQSDLIELLYSDANVSEIHIHHLLNSDLDSLQRVISKAPQIPVMMFLHDYYTICLNYNMMKNDEMFCGYGGVNKGKCSDCNYYRKTIKHSFQMREFISKIDQNLMFVIPSIAAKNVWCSCYKEYENRIAIVPHQNVKSYQNHIYGSILGNRNLRIAFVGKQENYKGWDVWNEIVKEYSNCYDFYVMNSNDEAGSNYEHVYVSVTPDNLDAMTEALLQQEIDIAFLWSKCQETYSYTYYESYMADAFVITNEISGNIAYQTKKNKNGIVLTNDIELRELLDKPNTLKRMVDDYRRNGLQIPNEMMPNDQIVHIKSDIKEIVKTPIKTKKSMVERLVIKAIDSLFRIKHGRELTYK